MMAVKRNTKIETKVPVVNELVKKVIKTGWLTNLGWGLLLVGGLAHMLPTQMEPLLKIAQFGISIQMLVGVLSVLVALNFLLGDE